MIWPTNGSLLKFTKEENQGEFNIGSKNRWEKKFKSSVFYGRFSAYLKIIYKNPVDML